MVGPKVRDFRGSHHLPNHVPRHKTVCVFRALPFPKSHQGAIWANYCTLNQMDFILKPDRKFSKARDIVYVSYLE